MVKKSKSNNSSGATQGCSQLDDEESLADWGFSDNYCHHCGKKNSEISGLLMQCGRCKKAYYCSNQCFKDGYPQHSLHCGTGKELGRAPETSNYADRQFFSKFGEKPLLGSTNIENQKKMPTTKVESKEEGKCETDHEKIMSKEEGRERSKKKKTVGDKKQNDTKKSRKTKESKKHNDNNVEGKQQKKKKSKRNLEEQRNQLDQSSTISTECDSTAPEQIKQVMNDSKDLDSDLSNKLPTINIFDDDDSNRITTPINSDDDGENMKLTGLANEHNEKDIPQMAVLDSDSATNDDEEVDDIRHFEVFGDTSNANKKSLPCGSSSHSSNVENQLSSLIRDPIHIEKEDLMEKETVQLRHVETSKSKDIRHKPEWERRSRRTLTKSKSSSSLLMEDLCIRSLDNNDHHSAGSNLSCDLSFHSCLTSPRSESKHNASSTKALKRSSSYKFLQKEAKDVREVVNLRTAPSLNKSEHARSEPEWTSKRQMLRRAVSSRGNELQNDKSVKVGVGHNIKLRNTALLSKSDHGTSSTERSCKNQEAPEWASKRLHLRSSSHSRKGMSLDSSHGRILPKVEEKDAERSTNDDSSSCPSSSVEFYDSDTDEASVSAGHAMKATQLKPNRRSIHAIGAFHSAPVLATLLEKQSLEPTNNGTSNAVWTISLTQKFTQRKGIVHDMDVRTASQVRKIDLLSKSDHIRTIPRWFQHLHDNQNKEVPSDDQAKMLIGNAAPASSDACFSSDTNVNKNSITSKSGNRNSVNFKPRNFTAPKRRSSSGSGSFALKRSTTSAPVLATLKEFNDEPDVASRGNFVWEKSTSLRNTQMGEILKTNGDIAVNRPDLLLESGKVQWEKPDWTSKKQQLKRVQSSVAKSA